MLAREVEEGPVGANARVGDEDVQAPEALGGVAAGAFSDAREAVDACVRVRDSFEPDPAWREVYDDGYTRFRALYPALRHLEEQ